MDGDACGEVLQQARGGHRAAQAQLVRRFADQWYRVSVSLLADRESARDAAQETALRFLQGLATFRGDSRLRTWSVGIAVNVCREVLRRQNRTAQNVAAGGATRVTPSPPEWIIAGREQAEHLHAMLSLLPSRQREALMLRYFEQLSVGQTAAVMQCATGTVKATVNQALRRLRREWKDKP